MFTLNYQMLADFCRCVSKMSDNTHVFFRNVNGILHIYAKSTEFYVTFIQDLEIPDEFAFGINSANFTAVVKKLDKKLPIEFNPTKARLFIKQGETEAKLPMLDTIIDFINLKDLTTYEIPDFVNNLIYCAKAIKEDKRFKGILVECGDSYTKFAKLGFASCGVAVTDSKALNCPRVVISSEAALVLKGFKDKDRKAILLNDNVFGVVLASGVTFYSMLLDDKLPQDLFTMFGQPDGNSFTANRKDLINILTSIHAVMGNDETGAIWTRIENDQNTWRISCKTYKGTEVAENLTVIDLPPEAEDFGVHRKAMMEALKAMDGDEVTIYIGTKSFVYMCSGDKKVALTKFSG